MCVMQQVSSKMLMRPLKENYKLEKSGFKGSFVTAFYNGERITIQKANELLQSEGNAVLELTTEEGVVNNVQSGTSKTGNDVVDNSKAVDTRIPVGESTSDIKPERPPIGMQLISKRTYVTYPRDIMNRYNAMAPFFYDEKRYAHQVENIFE